MTLGMLYLMTEKGCITLVYLRVEILTRLLPRSLFYPSLLFWQFLIGKKFKYTFNLFLKLFTLLAVTKSSGRLFHMSTTRLKKGYFRILVYNHKKQHKLKNRMNFIWTSPTLQHIHHYNIHKLKYFTYKMLRIWTIVQNEMCKHQLFTKKECILSTTWIESI